MLQAQFEAAFADYRDGRLGAADRKLRRLRKDLPDEPDILQLSALVAMRGGHPGGALPLLERALRLAPQQPALWSLYGNALGLAGRTQDSAAAFRQATALAPDSAADRYNLANALAALGETDGAVEAYRAAIRLEPGSADARFNLARLLRRMQRQDEARDALRPAADAQPDDPEIAGLYAALLVDAGDYDEAERRTARFDPRHSDSVMLLDACARLHYRRQELDAALDCAERAAALEPDNPRLRTFLAQMLHRLGRLDAAESGYRAALALAADEPETHVNLGTLLLLRGQGAEGWAEFGWRWRVPGQAPPDFPLPWWQGEPLAGRAILLWQDEGVGDVLCFGTLIPALLAQGARIRVECDARLIAMLERAFPGLDCRARQVPADPALAEGMALQCPFSELPRHLIADMETVVPPAAQVAADPARAAAARARYAALGPEPKIGISWATHNLRWPDKTASLAGWAPVLRCPGVRFVNLQYGDHAAEIAAAEARFGIAIHSDPAVDQKRSLEDFAAQIAALDLVISISCTTVHVAGALGVPTWVMLPNTPDWRHGLVRPASPWYRSVRYLRQAAPGRWDDVLAGAAAVLGGGPGAWTVAGG
ncbi:MAG: tetratricopeptide repeat protein [Alphaproteobacteria bacterium]